MKKNEFTEFKIMLDVKVEIDASIRRLGEKIGLLQRLQHLEALRLVSQLLADVDAKVDDIYDDVVFEEAICDE